MVLVLAISKIVLWVKAKNNSCPSTSEKFCTLQYYLAVLFTNFDYSNQKALLLIFIIFSNNPASRISPSTLGIWIIFLFCTLKEKQHGAFVPALFLDLFYIFIPAYTFIHPGKLKQALKPAYLKTAYLCMSSRVFRLSLLLG